MRREKSREKEEEAVGFHSGLFIGFLCSFFVFSSCSCKKQDLFFTPTLLSRSITRHLIRVVTEKTLCCSQLVRK